MPKQTPASIAALSAAASFGATGASMALSGAGVPLLLAQLGMGVCAGLLVYAMARGTLMSRDEAGPAEMAGRAEAAEARSAELRHDLRGAMSPALMVADRLVDHTDPAVSKAGDTIVRSIERATALISASKPHPAAAAEPPGPGAT